MRKFLISLFALICLACLGLAAACSGEPKYYVLTYQKMEGLTFDSEVLSGAEVKEGYTVNFRLVIDETKVTGELTGVFANKTELTASEDGVYSFEMLADTEITVEGIEEINRYTVKFQQGDYHSFTSELGDCTAEDGFTVVSGNRLTFTLKVSSYCVPEYEIVANTRVLTPLANTRTETDPEYEDYDLGYKADFSITVTGDTTINIFDLYEDEGFTAREDGGAGTPANPYKISKPIDLWYMANLVNGGFYANMATAYYELTDDINMRGEKLYIIGDDPENNIFFAGEFNGNGHTISNYVMDDRLIEQETFTSVKRNIIGLFGYASATYTRAPYIYDLNLADFVIDVNSVGEVEMTNVGSLVGLGIGVSVKGCSASGEIRIRGSETEFTYAGGLIGSNQSVYVSDNARYEALISNCHTNVDVIGNGGRIYCAGGIIGAAFSAVKTTTQAIINCYSEGDVVGAANAGGIAGALNPFTSVINCYSTGDIEARCNIERNVSYPEHFFYANAGGIVGNMDYDTYVANCFATGKTYASSVASFAGNSYSRTSAVAAYVNPGKTPVIEAGAAQVVNSKGITLTELTTDYVSNVLKWSSANWKMEAGSYPELVSDGKADKFTVTVNYLSQNVGGKKTLTLKTSDEFKMISSLYFDKILDEFVTADAAGVRSYGYFFDEACQNRVPAAYIPTQDITLYVGFADYSEIAGIYYLVPALAGSGIYLELLTDGTASYHNGAQIFQTIYIYDGETALIYDTLVARLNPDYSNNDDYMYHSFEATADANGNLVLKDITVYPDGIKAVKREDNFDYGVYYTGDTTYTFYTDGRGVSVSNTATTSFSYTVNGNSIGISLANGQSLTAVLENGKIVSIEGSSVNAQDKYAGSWQKSATTNKTYTFDGRGGWKYEGVGGAASGSYTLKDDGLIEFTHSGKLMTARFDDEGKFLIIGNGGGETYYAANSFTGEWRYNHKSAPINIVLEGISAEGYGLAQAVFGGESYGEYSLTYQAAGSEIVVFYLNDLIFGALKYNAEKNTLDGEFYSLDLGRTVNCEFFLYDDFRGVWVTSKSGLEFVEFDGKGSYRLAGSGDVAAVSGEVTVNGEKVGAYALENGAMSGSFTYGEVTYKISYNEETGYVDVTYGSGSGDAFVSEGEFTAIKADGWYGYELTDGASVYAFDGRGNLGGAVGVLTVTSTESVTYNYSNEADGSVTIYSEGSPIGSLTVDLTGNRFVLNLGNGEKALYVNNVFEGKWLVSGNYDYLEIGKIGAANTAQGTFLGENVTFVYNKAEKYLSFVYENETLYITSVGTETVELLVGSQPDVFGVNVVCIAADNADGYFGKVYTAADGSYYKFDGLGNSGYGKGRVTLYDKENRISEVREYSIVNGLPDSAETYFLHYVFREVAKADDAYVCDGKYYVFGLSDMLYNRSAKNTADKYTYTFDGFGTVKRNDGAVFTYTIDDTDTVKYEYNLTLKDSSGKEYTAVISYSDSRNLTMTVSPKTAEKAAE